jgi:hypothetical protein
MGRPLLGKSPFQIVQARFDPQMIDALDRGAAARGITRSQAVRLLVEDGLKTKGKRP